jgi:DNA replication protein DnaC
MQEGVMLNKLTLNQLHDLHLAAMAKKYTEICDNPNMDALTFEERFGIIVETQWMQKDTNRINRLINNAHFRFPASIEDIDYHARHGITKNDMGQLCAGTFIKKSQNIIFCGATGVGKTYIACALGLSICKQNIPVMYFRLPDLFQLLLEAQIDGRHITFQKKIANIPLLILDEWGLNKFSNDETYYLLELFEKRYGQKSTIICGQIPPAEWHNLFPDPTLADAILDRIIHNSYKFNLSGESMRKTRGEKEFTVL